jgi:hypothetical protein
MNYITIIDDRTVLATGYCLLQIRDDTAADNIIRALVENGMIVKRTHIHPGGLVE